MGNKGWGKPSAATGEVEPPTDAATVRAELEAVLREDDTALGDVFRRIENGDTDEQIRVARGNQTSNFMWNKRRTITALLDGSLPTAPTVALQNLRSFRRILRENESLTPATRAELERRVVLLEQTAHDRDARAREDEDAVQATEKAEENAVAGVYVYSLPHYIRHPYDEDSGRTLLKVGRADRSVIRRFREQVRTTALPEDPVLLRIYVCDEDRSLEMERTFHRLLEAADHDRSTARTGGTEWFLTSVRFTDEVASTLNLEVRDVTKLADTLD